MYTLSLEYAVLTAWHCSYLTENLVLGSCPDMPDNIIQLHLLQLVGVLAMFQRGKRFPRNLKDVPGGFPKSDLLGVTVALIHVAAQRFLAV